MENDRRHEGPDRRAHSHGGRRAADGGRPWYLRRRLWLAVGSALFVGWRRVRSIARRA